MPRPEVAVVLRELPQQPASAAAMAGLRKGLERPADGVGLDVTPPLIDHALGVLTATISIYPPGTTKAERAQLAVRGLATTWVCIIFAALFAVAGEVVAGLPGIVTALGAWAALTLAVVVLTSKYAGAVNVPPPLSSRVAAPAVIEPPRHPDVAVWRAYTLDDIDVIMPARRAMDAADHPSWVTPRDELVDDLTMSHIDPAADTMLALDATGAVLAYGQVSLGPGQETRVQSYMFGGVHPDYRDRGIGGQLLAWQRARSEQQLASSDKTLPGWSVLYLEEDNAAAMSLAERNGMSLVRYFTQMERDLEESIPQIAAPDGIRIVRFTRELSELTRAARNDSFRDHWGSQPTNRERWEQFVFGAQFRNDLSWVALEGDDGAERVVAIGLSTVNEDDWVAQGRKSAYIDLIGVVRDWRGRKLAPAVLSAVLASHRDAGLAASILDVDSESPTGANALYERMGFVATHRELAFVAEY